MQQDCDFEFFVDLEKSEGSTDDERRVRGMASCEDLDLQGEIVVQKGMDTSYLKSRGWINWDHKDGPENLIGYPVSVEIVRAEHHPVLGKSGTRGLAMYVEALLKKGLERADATWFHLQNPSPGRTFAWSIQGKVGERDGRKITKSQIRHLAITHQPVQTRSFAEIAKSLAKTLDTVNSAPLALENLHGRLTSTLWGDCGRNCYDNRARFRKGVRGALEHLTACHEVPLNEATEFLKALMTSRIARPAA